MFSLYWIYKDISILIYWFTSKLLVPFALDTTPRPKKNDQTKQKKKIYIYIYIFKYIYI